MAEHLRNEFARERFVFSPKVVSTFGKFVTDFVPELRPVSRAALELIVSEELLLLPPGRYANVRDFAGFRAALVRAVEEFAGAGANEAHLQLVDSDFAKVYRAVINRLKDRGEYFRSSRLIYAAEAILSASRRGTICIVGFFSFTPIELNVLKALDQAGYSVTVSLPETPGSRVAVDALRLHGAKEESLTGRTAFTPRTLVTASTVGTEADEIARRILWCREQGIDFREMGIVVRSETPSVPALRSALERFQIPFRSYFAPTLRSDPTVRFLMALADAALSGWDHEISLKALRLHGSPLELWGDVFEHRILQTTPALGLDGLREAAPDFLKSWFAVLDGLTSWVTGTAVPEVWSLRFQGLPALYWRAPTQESPTQEQVLEWRRESSALEFFSACVSETARSFPPDLAINCRKFQDALEVALFCTELRVVDRRRNVVHIVDAVEARQWRFKVLFVCGLLEGSFPKRHTQDPILADAVRLQLKDTGVPLRTTSERQSDEQLLFDLTLTAATGHVFLSYALLNEKGEPNLPSFFLERAEPYATEYASLVRPSPAWSRASDQFPVIASEELRAKLGERFSSLSTSKVERYLTCPWSFFGEHILRLAERPAGKWERLDPRIQGQIAHEVFEHVLQHEADLTEIFDDVFARYCEKEQVPDGYRTEAIRLELLHGVRQLASDFRVETGGNKKAFFELKFEYDLTPEVRIKGKIDRLIVDQQDRAVIFDYKYRRKNRIDQTALDNEKGKRVQSGLYLAAVQNLGYRPVGMVYLGFKREASHKGLILQGEYPQFKSDCSQSQLDELMYRAKEVTLQVQADIADGRIRPQPAALRDCEYCAYSAICRVEAIPEPAVEVVNAAQ
ncbi:MAG: PD-(D/E)XK nuclease family protein [Bryobacteraceae bacterium]|nr:PD-(D/E)XK nuclease family protein [Bryobacteraceae bacterium]